MTRYAARKVLLALPLLWGVITVLFLLVELSPGTYADKYLNPAMSPEVAEMVRAKYQLDAPGWVRYVAMLRNLARLDFGISMDGQRPVFDVIAEAVPHTLVLSGVTLGVLYPTGIALGTLQAVGHNRWSDTAASITALFFYSMPTFWLAMMLQLVVSYELGGWIERTFAGTPLVLLALPSSDPYDAVAYDSMGVFEQAIDRVRHILLPGVAMGLAGAAGTARYMRSSMLEVIRQDYVRTARAKGLREGQVILGHALRNALLPLITLFGLSLPFLFSGAVLVETIFAWPGMGRLIVNAILQQDTPLIVACFFVSTVLVLLGSLLADLAYAWADPRIRLDG
ncbi:MAG: ABC transporter permease [Deltaproteobacteria bacterium]|nr:ABC transporter permease [Deltaproteobacteria bacterium]